MEMGYKCASFGIINDLNKGISHLEYKSDTLKIYYKNIITGTNLFIAKKI